MKNLVLKPLSSTSSNRVSEILRTLAGRSRRGSYCVAAPTEKCSVDTSCSCPTGSTKHSHTYGNETAAGTCHTCDTCPLKSTKCCNGNCIDSDYIQDGGKFAAVPTLGDYAHDFRNYCRTQDALKSDPASFSLDCCHPLYPSLFLFFILLSFGTSPDDDCGDGSDEASAPFKCASLCEPGYSKCCNGKCISSSDIRNG